MSVLTNRSAQQLQQLDFMDDFFDCFWCLEEARRKTPPQVDYFAHQSKSRVEAERVLEKRAPGTYLIRGKTSGDGQLVISTIHEEGFWHGVIEVVTVDDGERTYMLRGSNKRQSSLESLVGYYMNHPYSNSGGKMWYLGMFCAVPKKPASDLH